MFQASSAALILLSQGRDYVCECNTGSIAQKPQLTEGHSFRARCVFPPLRALKDTTRLHVLTSRVYDPSLAWRDPAEGDKQRAHPFVMFLSVSVLLQLLMNEERGEDTFSLSRSRSAISQLKHVEVTRGGFVTQDWARSSHTGWALNYADQGWICETSTVHDGGYSLQKAKTEDRWFRLPGQ